MKAIKRRKLFPVEIYGLLSSVALVALLPGYACAQTVAPASAEEEQAASGAPLEDIVVTAQRRSERLQQVPVAVSAVTAAALEAGGVKGLDTIQTAVPGLSVQNASGALALHLRGVGAIYGGPGYENPIALYVDGVYYASQNVGLMQFNNVERIASERIGRETVTYVSNIYKYYVTYLLVQGEYIQRQAIKKDR